MTTVFLDRDVTILRPPGVGRSPRLPREVELRPGSGEAIGRLNRRHVHVVVTTHEPALASGELRPAVYRAVHARMLELLAAAAAQIDAHYLCPHQTGTCSCRKPLPGLIVQALVEHPEIDLDECLLVGDAADVQLARSLGLPGVQVWAAEPEAADPAAHRTVPSLAAAVEWIVNMRLHSAPSPVSGAGRR